jgi:hypothetical protein
MRIQKNTNKYSKNFKHNYKEKFQTELLFILTIILTYYFLAVYQKCNYKKLNFNFFFV